MDAQSNQKAVLDMINMIEDSMKQIELIKPEWKRSKK